MVLGEKGGCVFRHFALGRGAASPRRGGVRRGGVAAVLGWAALLPGWSGGARFRRAAPQVGGTAPGVAGATLGAVAPLQLSRRRRTPGGSSVLG